MSDAFAREAREDVQRLSDGLVRLELEGIDRNTVDDLFRRAHSLKGTLGMEGHSSASELAHALEDLLDAVRADEVALEGEVVDAGLDAADLLEEMVDEVAQTGQTETDPEETIRRLRDAVDAGSSPSRRRQDDGAGASRGADTTDDGSGSGAGLDPDPATDDSVGFGRSEAQGSPGERSEPDETEESVEAVSFEDTPDDAEPDESDIAIPGEGLEDTPDDAEPDESDELSAEEALEAASEFDDLEELVEEIDDDAVSEFEGLEGGGAFRSAETTDESDEAASGSESDRDPPGVEAFVEAKATIDDDPAVDELQSEIEAVSFGEFDDDDDMSIQDLVGLNPDDSEVAAVGSELTADASATDENAPDQVEPEASTPTAETPDDPQPADPAPTPETPDDPRPAEAEEESTPEIDELVGDEFGSAFDEATESAGGEPPSESDEEAAGGSGDGESEDGEDETEALREVLEAMGAADEQAETETRADEPTAPTSPSELDAVTVDAADESADAEFQRDSGLEAFESRFDGAFDRGESDRDRTRAAPTFEKSSLPTEQFRAANEESGLADERRPDEVQSLTVDVEYADDLLSLVADLSVDLQRLRSAADPDGEVTSALEEVESTTRALQRTVMDVRLMPLRTITSGLQRVVRDVARETGVEARLRTDGEDVKLDRSIISQIGDPIVHLVRNAVDHGIEPPAERRAAGKPETGTVELRARRSGDDVVIEVADDGCGVDADRVRETAVAEGVVDAAEARAASDDEVYDLLFHPGLSTRDEVTETSGRGVGMDVVREAVDALNGSVAVESAPGEGTLVRLTLPVSVAMAEVLFVEAGGERFALPKDGVEYVGRSGMSSIGGAGGLLAARTESESESEGEQVDLAAALGTGETGPDAAEVSVARQDGRVVLRCDRVLDTREAVITPYDDLLSNVGVVSGTTTDADGRLVNVIDVGEL